MNKMIKFKKIYFCWFLVCFLIILFLTQSIMATRGIVASTRSTTTTKPVYMTWSGTAWGTLANATAVGNTIQILHMIDNPSRNESVLVTLDTDADIDAQIWNGTRFGPVTEMTASSSSTTTRAFDMAVEKNTGRVFVFYDNSTNGVIAYKIWDGASWSSEQLVYVGSSTTDWIRAEGKNNSREIMLVSQQADLSIYAIIWNGTGWETPQTLETTTEQRTSQTFGLSYENSGDAVIAWADGALTKPDYITYSSAGVWGEITNLANDAGDSATITWVRMVNYPGTDKIMLCHSEDNADDIDCVEWNGNAWGTGAAVETSTEAFTGQRLFDVAPIRSTGGYIMVYGNSNVDYFSAYQCNSAANCAGGTWSANIVSPFSTQDIGTDTNWVNLDYDVDNSSRVFALMRDQTALLGGAWKGRTACTTATCTSVENSNAITTTNSQLYEQFEFVFNMFSSDKLLPVTTLIHPLNGSSKSTQVDFNCSTIDNVGLKNITLYGNWSGWGPKNSSIITKNSNSSQWTHILDGGTYLYNCYTCDVNNLCAFSQQNFTFKVSSDSCTYGGSGNWELNCADDCVFDSTTTIGNQDNITITGTGTLTFNNNGRWSFTGTNQYINIGSGCTLNINTGGGWNY